MGNDEQGSRTLASVLLSSGSRRSAAAPESPRERAGGQLDLLFSTEPAASSDELAPPAGPTAPPARVKRRRETSRRVWSVAALVADVRGALESGYEEVWVAGEVSNCRPAPSGHLYFTLKDGDAQLAVVLFRRQAVLLRFAPRDGMEVLARGRLSLYDARGQLQLIAESLEPRGAGSLQFAFEQLKAKLLAEGLFDADRKRPLPSFPSCIGIVTSTAGAVLHDIIRVVRRRHACLDLLIYPAAMQGPECASSIRAGIRWFNQASAHGAAKRVDLIVLARGGGSPEDLAGFNDEALARAIAASELPVVSAIGHETDFTIADFVADLRAPTPSAAAEMITAAQHRIEEHVHALEVRAVRAVQYRLMLARQHYTRLSAPQILARVRDVVGRRAQTLDELHRRLELAWVQRLRAFPERLEQLRMRLERANPRAALLAARRRLEAAERMLPSLSARTIAPHRAALDRASGRLAALSPLAVLGRGYALVYAEDGRLMRDAAHARPGQIVRARLERGSLDARVLAVDEEPKQAG